MTLGSGIRLALLAVLAVLVGTAALVGSRRPSLDLDWDEDVRVLADVDFRPDGTIALGHIRDWTYAGDSVVSRRYFDGRYDPDDVEAMWLYEQELGLGGRIAHTFLVFQFDEVYGDERWLGLSVETRRERGEKYSLLRGMLKGFEVTHVWATENDLVRRRVEHLDYPLTRYRVDVPADYRARIFRALAGETAELAKTPRWYHTLTTNCTSSLIRYVNRAEPGAIPAHYSSVLTGRADDHLARLGYLDPGSELAVTRGYLAANPLR